MINQGMNDTLTVSNVPVCTKGNHKGSEVKKRMKLFSAESEKN